MKDALLPTFFELVCNSKQFKSIDLGTIDRARFVEFLTMINLHQVPLKSLAFTERRSLNSPDPKEVEELFKANVWLTEFKCGTPFLDGVQEYIRRNKLWKYQKRFKSTKVAPHSAGDEIVGTKRTFLELDSLEDCAENKSKQQKVAHNSQ